MADAVVPPDEARRIERCVRAVAPSAEVRLRLYDGMGHSTCAAEVEDIRTFLAKMVDGQGTKETSLPPPPLAGALRSMKASELKQYLQRRGVSVSDCFERSDLLARALESANKDGAEL